MYFYKATQETRFDFSSDFSGDVVIRKPNGDEISIPGFDLLEFVAYEYVSRKRIAQIENASFDEILKGKV